MLKLNNIEKQYPQFHLKCSLKVPENRITALIGPNGAGKTTTFKAILGLIHLDKGDIHIFNKPAERLTSKDRALIGVALSDSNFSGYLTIQDVISMITPLYPEFNKEQFTKNCMQFNLPLNKKIKEFSTGMKAKLKILTAVSHNARLLILDEPTAGLDVLARQEILDILREYMLPGDRSVLISSHISSDLEELCDDIYLIHQGQILLYEETHTLLDCYGILKVTEEQYKTLDQTYLIQKKKESYGYSLLTSQKQYYQENAPELSIEKCTIDEMILMMIKGESI